MRVKQERLDGYVPYKGSDGESSSEVEDDNTESVAASKAEDGYSQIDEGEIMNPEEFGLQFEKMQKKMMSAKNLRNFLQGIQLYVKFKGVKLNVFSPIRMVVKNQQMRPNLSFDLDGFNLFLTCLDDYRN